MKKHLRLACSGEHAWMVHAINLLIKRHREIKNIDFYNNFRHFLKTPIQENEEIISLGFSPQDEHEQEKFYLFVQKHRPQIKLMFLPATPYCRQEKIKSLNQEQTFVHLYSANCLPLLAELNYGPKEPLLYLAHHPGPRFVNAHKIIYDQVDVQGFKRLLHFFTEAIREVNSGKPSPDINRWLEVYELRQAQQK